MQNGNIRRVERIPGQHSSQRLKESRVQPHPPEVQGHVGDLVVSTLGLRLHLLLQPPLEVPGALVAPGGTDRLQHGLRVEIGLLTVTHQVSEVSEVALDLGAAGGGELEEGSLEEAGEHLGLVGRRRGIGDLTLIASIGDEFDGELQHEAIRVLLGELVEELPPGGVLDHLFQPGRGLHGRKQCNI